MAFNTDIAIVGGGVSGAAASYFLSKHYEHVAVFEAGTIGGAGATSYSGGICRSYDTDEDLQKLAIRGVHLFNKWQKGKKRINIGFNKCGVVYLGERDRYSKFKKFENSHNNGRRSFESGFLSPTEMPHSWLSHSVDRSFLLERTGGYGNPRLTAQSLIDESKRQGATVFEHTKIERIQRIHSGWEILTANECIRCQHLVLACGAFSKKLLPDLPIRIKPIPLLQLANRCESPLIDEELGIYVTPHSSVGAVCGSVSGEYFESLEEIDIDFDAFKKETLRKLRLILKEDMEIVSIGHLLGFDAYTENNRPMIGRCEGEKGLWLSTGYSGRGYKSCLSAAEELFRVFQQADMLKEKHQRHLQPVLTVPEAMVEA